MLLLLLLKPLQLQRSRLHLPVLLCLGHLCQLSLREHLLGRLRMLLSLVGLEMLILLRSGCLRMHLRVEAHATHILQLCGSKFLLKWDLLLQLLLLLLTESR